MRNRSIIAAVAAAALLGGAVIAFDGNRQIPGTEQLPADPQGVELELLEAHPFELLEADTHHMRAEAPSYDSGMVLVLAGDPAILRPRQGYENVLYVGAETAARVNSGERSGHLVVIVPGLEDASSAPIFLGEPALPENVTAAEAQRQLALALDAGVPTQTPAVAGEPVVVRDGYELRHFASFLVERYASDEVDVITGLRAERIEFR